jgi:hypothetical protein
MRAFDKTILDVHGPRLDWLTPSLGLRERAVSEDAWDDVERSEKMTDDGDVEVEEEEEEEEERENSEVVAVRCLSRTAVKKCPNDENPWLRVGESDD